MKLSKKTIGILKNFSTINSGIQFMEGNEIRIAKIDKSVMGIATVEETFPDEFAIYDLPQFLGVISMFEEPELEFEDDYVVVREDNQRVKIVHTDSSNIVAAPYGLDLQSEERGLFINKDQLDLLNKSSAIMKLGDFALVKEGDKVQFIVEDASQDSNNEMRIDVDFNVEMEDFELQLKMKTLNFVKADYEIGFADDNQFLIFSNEDEGLKYYVAVQS